MLAMRDEEATAIGIRVRHEVRQAFRAFKGSCATLWSSAGRNGPIAGVIGPRMARVIRVGLTWNR